MKSNFRNLALALLVLGGVSAHAQKNSRSLDNYREPDKNGINVFEAPKDTVSTFEEVKVRIGGSSTLQFQALEHKNNGGVELVEIGNNFNLATANLDIDVALYDGIRMHLRTYLSSRHHPEPYVKGGYFQIDKLNFIEEGFLDNIMKFTTIKVGHMENNYGDAHFRRTDNAQAIYNPFVGNMIMDGFTTEVGAEVYYQRDGFIGMVGFTNGKLNQSVDNPDSGGASFLAKLGYDKQIDSDLRLRVTGSVYTTGKVANSYLYSADRAGSRYYLVLEEEGSKPAGAFRSGRYDPKMGNQITAVMFNPFVKYKGLEFFGTYERTSGKFQAEDDMRVANQYAGELIYRFGNNENIFVAGRYNLVDSEDISGDDVEISRLQFSAGWFLTRNILVKAEYVTQKHKGYSAGSILDGGKFDGLMAEAVISF